MNGANEVTNTPEFDLADRLRKALRVSNVSVNDMAEYLCVNRNTVGRWINGEREPKVASVRLWSMRTGVSLEWLLHGCEAQDDADLAA